MAVEKRFPPWLPNEILNKFLPPLQGGALLSGVLGLKPQAQSYSPFGTKNSIRSKYLSTFSKPHQSVGVLEYRSIAPCPNHTS